MASKEQYISWGQRQADPMSRAARTPYGSFPASAPGPPGRGLGRAACPPILPEQETRAGQGKFGLVLSNVYAPLRDKVLVRGFGHWSRGVAEVIVDWRRGTCYSKITGWALQPAICDSVPRKLGHWVSLVGGRAGYREEQTTNPSKRVSLQF